MSGAPQPAVFLVVGLSQLSTVLGTCTSNVVTRHVLVWLACATSIMLCACSLVMSPSTGVAVLLPMFAPFVALCNMSFAKALQWNTVRLLANIGFACSAAGFISASAGANSLANTESEELLIAFVWAYAVNANYRYSRVLCNRLQQVCGVSKFW